MLRSFRELQVWQKSYALALDVYSVTSDFPSHEAYGLTAQIRRAPVSVPSNIAEGYSRGHTMDYVRFANMAYGSLAELHTQLMLARDLGYMNQDAYDAVSGRYGEVERMLAALIRGLKSK